MFRDNRKDFQEEQLINYSFISLDSSKLRVGVVGGGRAGEIKAKHFVKNKCLVEILSKEFNEKIINISKENEKLKLIQDDFNYDFLKDKHIIIIAASDETICEKIRKYCDENSKIYIDSSDFKKGMGVIPVQKSSENINFALSTNGGNPKGSVFVSNKVKSVINEYDEFIYITTKIRNNIKKSEYKNDVFEVIYSDEFMSHIKNKTYLQYLKSKFSEDIIKQVIK